MRKFARAAARNERGFSNVSKKKRSKWCSVSVEPRIVNPKRTGLRARIPRVGSNSRGERARFKPPRVGNDGIETVAQPWVVHFPSLFKRFIRFRRDFASIRSVSRERLWDTTPRGATGGNERAPKTPDWNSFPPYTLKILRVSLWGTRTRRRIMALSLDFIFSNFRFYDTVIYL